jgi:antitoxin MazE
MVKKLTRHGNSLALVIDKPILELLNITEDTPLSITTDSGCLVIARAKSEDDDAKFNAALEKVNRKWGTVLKKLAR